MMAAAAALPAGCPCCMATYRMRALWHAGWLHPTINLSDPESGVNPTRVVAGAKQHHPVNVALSNSFGFGGHNSCIMFKAHTA